MKIRLGFVSNSSSSSFIVYLPKNFTFFQNQIDKVIGDYCDKENEEEFITKLNDAINLIKSGNTITEYDNPEEFDMLDKLIDSKYIIGSFDTGSGCGKITGIVK